MPYTVMLDASHGGFDNGATYEGRVEKDETLRLTLAVGEILQQRGVNVLYTRTEDIYETPTQKAQEGNVAGADYFVSIHRNSSPSPNQYTGIESLVYSSHGPAAEMAANINSELEAVGFVNHGVNERRNLAILQRTYMPTVLVEVGFINSDPDNALFDNQFYNIAYAMANGILASTPDGA